MKKRVLALVLALAMLLSLAACGSKNESGDASGSASGDGYVAVFYYQYSDTYISSVRAALDSQFDTAGVNYQDFDANASQTTQSEQVTTAIANGATMLVVNIVDTASDDAANSIVEQAQTANIPVVFFNREVSDDVVNSYDQCAFVGTDAAEAGHMQGEMIGTYLNEHFDEVDLNGDGVITYAMFKGQEGNNEAIYRTQYSVEDANTLLTEAGHEALQYFDSSNTDCYQVDQDGSWSAKAATDYMNTNLSKYSESNDNMIEMVICNNDGMAEGAISALNDAGYNLGTADSTTIPVFGVDATDAAKELIAAGKMTGTIKQDAAGMAEAIALLVNNASSGSELMAGTDSYNVDSSVAKIRIAYGIYTGETASGDK